MPNYSYECKVCAAGEELILFAKYEERDNQVCPECSTPVTRQISAPNVMRASYPDGTKRKGFQDLKEAAKLNREAAGEKAGSERRKEIVSQIRKMRVDISKDKA